MHPKNYKIQYNLKILKRKFTLVTSGASKEQKVTTKRERWLRVVPSDSKQEDMTLWW